MTAASREAPPSLRSLTTRIENLARERGHTVKTSWWSGEADISTYETSEMLATKLRALYQRSKGRDLFDLWLGLTILKADPDQIIAGFNHYMPGRARGWASAAWARRRARRRPCRGDRSRSRGC